MPGNWKYDKWIKFNWSMYVLNLCTSLLILWTLSIIIIRIFFFFLMKEKGFVCNNLKICHIKDHFTIGYFILRIFFRNPSLLSDESIWNQWFFTIMTLYYLETKTEVKGKNCCSNTRTRARKKKKFHWKVFTGFFFF